jgi:hypothetical protein
MLPATTQPAGTTPPWAPWSDHNEVDGLARRHRACHYEVMHSQVAVRWSEDPSVILCGQPLGRRAVESALGDPNAARVALLVITLVADRNPS